MTKGRKTMSKANESTSKNLQRAFRFGRGDTGQSEDVYALNIDSVEAVEVETSELPNIPLTTSIPLVRILRNSLPTCYCFILI